MTNHAYNYSNSNYQQNSSGHQRLKAIDFMGEDGFKIKAYTKSELADMYGVHVNTLSKWIEHNTVALYTNALFSLLLR